MNIFLTVRCMAARLFPSMLAIVMVLHLCYTPHFVVATTCTSDIPIVSNLYAQGGDGTVTLRWDSVQDAINYNIYRKKADTESFESIRTTTDLTFSDAGVDNGTRYAYAVTATIGSDKEGPLSDFVYATPSLPIQSVVITQPTTTPPPIMLGAGKQTPAIEVVIDIPGLTNDLAHSGKAAPTLGVWIGYYLEGTDKALAEFVPMSFKADTNDGKKVYEAMFEPTERGTYLYFARVSNNNQETYTESSQSQLVAEEDQADMIPPNKPELLSINVALHRVDLNWSASSSSDLYRYEVHRKTNATDYRKLAVVDPNTTSYIDTNVSNDTTYTYKIAAVDKSYNREFSNEKTVVTPLATPIIVPADQTVNVGDPASLTVVASGGVSLTYQWYENTTNSPTGGTLITGATCATYSAPMDTPGTRYYYVEVTNTDATVNKTTKTSNVATVTVNALTNAEEPSITTEPESKTVNQGETAELTVVATTNKGNLSYQWYDHTTNSNSGGTLIPNATSTTYTIPTGTQGTKYYYVVVTNTDKSATGIQTATKASNVATVVVNALTNAEEPSITTEPESKTVTIGETAELTVVATTSKGNLSYQWYEHTTNSNSGGTPIPNATNTTYTIPTGTQGTKYYYVVVTNTDNSATGNKTAPKTSSVATVVVNAKSQNANLGALTLSNGTLNQPFDKDVISYTVNVPNVISSITLSPIVEDTGKATVTVNNQPSSTAVPLNVGTNTIQVVVTAEDGVMKKTYTLIVNRAQPSSSGGGGSTPTPQPEPPKTEIITVPIDAGGSNVSIVVKRTTDANGNKKDEVELTPKDTVEVVRKLKEAGLDTARIVIPDTKDEVSEINLSINKEAIQAFQQGAINLEIYTENARILVPKDSVNEISDDLYFRVLPIKEEQQKNVVKERAKQEEIVRKVAGSLNINVVGRPMTIETNMPNQPVDLILPLKGLMIPTEAKEREEFFNKLGVFIEHSDGEKVFIKGEVVPYKNGELGLKFTVSKFSTFTIINMENGWKEPNFNDQFTGRTSEFELPVMVDKVWNIKFNYAVKSSTVNNETVYMYDQNGEKIEIDIQLTNNNQTIKVSPNPYYKPNTKYYLYLSENIESSNGKRFVASERYVFKTSPYSLGTGKWQEKINVSPDKEWTVTFNADINQTLLTDNHVFVTDQHGRKIEVDIEMINSRIIKIKPVNSYNYGQTYYLFMKGLESDKNIAMKNQIWMKFTIESEVE